MTERDWLAFWAAERAIADACRMRAPSVRGLPIAETSRRRLCYYDGAELTGRRVNWCSNGCPWAWLNDHQWSITRRRALERDHNRCVRPGCGQPAREVNHIEPRRGGGYHVGCHNHLGNLESLCHPHHRVETNRQRREAGA